MEYDLNCILFSSIEPVKVEKNDWIDVVTHQTISNMESSEDLSSGSFLGKILHKVVENSLRKGKSNNNSKNVPGYKVLHVTIK